MQLKLKALLLKSFLFGSFALGEVWNMDSICVNKALDTLNTKETQVNKNKVLFFSSI